MRMKNMKWPLKDEVSLNEMCSNERKRCRSTYRRTRRLDL